MSNASSKAIVLPVAHSSMARALPTRRGTLCAPPRQSRRAPHAPHHAEVDLRQPHFAAFFLCNTDVAGHSDLQTAADRMAVDGRDDNFGGVLKAHKHLVAMESEVVL